MMVSSLPAYSYNAPYAAVSPYGSASGFTDGVYGDPNGYSNASSSAYSVGQPWQEIGQNSGYGYGAPVLQTQSPGYADEYAYGYGSPYAYAYSSAYPNANTFAYAQTQTQVEIPSAEPLAYTPQPQWVPPQPLPAASSYPSPYPVSYPLPHQNPITEQLLATASLDDHGQLRVSPSRINAVVQQGPGALPTLLHEIAQPASLPRLLAAFLTTQSLVRAGAPSTGIYGIASRWNYSDDPLVQTYLSGLYRDLNEPAAFGPLCIMLLRHALFPQPPSPLGDPAEEIGGALLELLSRWQPRPLPWG